MTKPNLFILDSDYLTIAQNSRNTFTYTVAGGTIPAGGQINQGTDFAIATQKGAIDHVMIKLDNGNYALGQQFGVTLGSSGFAGLRIYRTAPNILHAALTLSNLTGPSPVDYPMMTFTIKISSFKPPNVF